MTSRTRGAVAAGHPKTAEAAVEILHAGGNAFDATVAGLFAATVAEPLLAGLGGAGFALTESPVHGRCVYDFFAQTPLRAGVQPDFSPIEGDFGGARQTFYIGAGTVAVPGFVHGLLAMHEDLGSVPLRVCLEPAIAFARDGVEVNGFQAHVAEILTPIVTANASVSGLYGLENGTVIPGRAQVFPVLADVLEGLGREPTTWFYVSEPAKFMVGALDACGHLRAEDFAAYRTVKRRPLTFRFGNATVHTNPAPACGGIMVAMTLALYERLRNQGNSSLQALTEAMLESTRIRRETRVQEQPEGERVLGVLRSLGIEPATIGAVQARSQTTHISVVDGQGNLASATVSNGEGSGCVVPELGVHLNNFLGEEDINPRGIGHWEPSVRMASMMAPSIIDRSDGGRIAIGSGGSERIRTAIVQVIIRLIEDGMTPDAAVKAARFHADERTINAEPGAVQASLEHRDIASIHRWDQPSLYFGGVHVSSIHESGLRAAGDPRRGGVGVVV